MSFVKHPIIAQCKWSSVRRMLNERTIVGKRTPLFYQLVQDFDADGLKIQRVFLPLSILRKLFAVFYLAISEGRRCENLSLTEGR